MATPSRNWAELSQPSVTTCCSSKGMMTNPPPNTSRPVLKNSANSWPSRSALIAVVARVIGASSAAFTADGGLGGDAGGAISRRLRPASSSSTPAGMVSCVKLLSSPPSMTSPAVSRCQPARRLQISFQAKVQMMEATTGCRVCSAVVKVGIDCPFRQSSLSPSTISSPGSRKHTPLTMPPIKPRCCQPR